MKHWIIIILLFTAGLGYAQPNLRYSIEGKNVVVEIDAQWLKGQKDSVMRSFGFIQVEPALGQVSGEGWKVRKKNSSVIVLERDMRELVPADDWNTVEKSLMIEEEDASKAIFKNVHYLAPQFKKTRSYQFLRGDQVAFYLPGYSRADEVYLSGDFNDWSTVADRMERTSDGWTIIRKLEGPLHFYKFNVDGRWKTDPLNRHAWDDGMGNVNSVLVRPNTNFFLPGHLNKNVVFVSGNFNGWNEGELRMSKTDSGWILPIYLLQGTWQYKFLADGEWLLDPHNPNKTEVAEGYINSVKSIGNPQSFCVSSFETAGQVALAGEFNDWQEGELLMKNTTDGWEVDYVLPPGSYLYKLVVDGQWQVDPTNPYRHFAYDTENCVLNVRPNYTFRIPASQVQNEVYLSGTFNNWAEPGYKMLRNGDHYEFPLHLERGKHLYKFIIDDSWHLDPTNKQWEQNQYGTSNSVLWIE